jgi:RimJ/RimL family protein N-acetyltransferase
MSAHPQDDCPQILASLPMRAGLLSLRRACPEDATAFVEYWTESSPSYLATLGVDTSRLGDGEQIRERFLRNLPSSTPLEQTSVIYSLYLEDVLIGYTNLNRYDDLENYAHLHTYRKALRLALGQRPKSKSAGGGIAACLIGLVFMHHFETFGMSRLVIQTRTRNRSINRALDLYLPVSNTCHFEKPDGLSAPGEFHMRYAYYEHRHYFRTRAQELAAFRQEA